MLEFTIFNNKGTELIVMDITKPGIPGLPNSIDTLTLGVVSSVIPTINLPELDVLAYLRRTQRDNELYILTPAVLGLGHSETVPDGIYHMELRMNNQITVTETYVNYYHVLTALTTITDELDFDIEVTQEGYEFTTEDGGNNAELLAVAWTLYHKMIILAVKEDEVAVNNMLDKLKRILTLIKPDYVY